MKIEFPENLNFLYISNIYCNLDIDVEKWNRCILVCGSE